MAEHLAEHQNAPGRVATILDSAGLACLASQRDSRRLTMQYNGVPPRQRPAGDSRVTDRTGRILASSMATQPPREFPAR